MGMYLEIAFLFLILNFVCNDGANEKVTNVNDGSWQDLPEAVDDSGVPIDKTLMIKNVKLKNRCGWEPTHAVGGDLENDPQIQALNIPNDWFLPECGACMARVPGGCQRNNLAYHVDCSADILFTSAHCVVDYSPEFWIIIVIIPSIIVASTIFCLMCIKCRVCLAYKIINARRSATGRQKMSGAGLSI